MGFKQRPKLDTDRIRRESMDAIAASALKELLRVLPVESGHAHEAFCTAQEQVDLPVKTQVSHVLLGQTENRSGDAMPQRYAKGRFTEGKKKSRMQIQVGLPFVTALDQGMPIKPIQPGGFKKGGLATAGELYSKRRVPAPRRGVLMWMQGGEPVFRPVRIPQAFHFIAAAISSADSTAQTLGWSKQ